MVDPEEALVSCHNRTQLSETGTAGGQQMRFHPCSTVRHINVNCTICRMVQRLDNGLE